MASMTSSRLSRIQLSFLSALVLAAITGYYRDQFGVMVDTVRLEKVLQSDPAEM
jgi:Phosphoethanolamine transferase EptA/EptB